MSTFDLWARLFRDAETSSSTVKVDASDRHILGLSCPTFTYVHAWDKKRCLPHHPMPPGSSNASVIIKTNQVRTLVVNDLFCSFE